MQLRTIFLLIVACTRTSFFAQAKLYTAADVERDYKASFNDRPDYFWLDPGVTDSIRTLRLKSGTFISEYMSEGKKTLSRSTSYYDEAGRMIKSIDRGENPSTSIYSYSPDGRSMLYTFSRSGTQAGRDSVYFNDQRRVVKVICWRKGELPRRYFYTYGQTQQITGVRFVQGKYYKTVELRYNSHNTPVFRLEMEGKSKAPADTVSFTQIECEAQGRIISRQIISKFLSHGISRRTYRYDEEGRLLLLGERREGYTINGEVMNSESSTNFSYDNDHRLQKEEFHANDSCPAWKWKEHHYSATGDTVFTYGCEILHYYTAVDPSYFPKYGRPVVLLSTELFIKDKAGRLVEWQQLSPQLSVLGRQQYTYDTAGHLLEYRLNNNSRSEESYTLHRHRFNEKGLEIESTEMEDGEMKHQCRYEYTFY